jgi:spore germination cell wall hydrolase CwlJ-like protein
MKAKLLWGIVFVFLAYLMNQSRAWADQLYAFNNNQPQSEYECLAEALYFEGAIDGAVGMYLIANVITNRVNDDKLEFRDYNTWCDVVHQPSRDPNRPWECAFSYYCDGKPETVPNLKSEQSAASQAQWIAWQVIKNSPYGVDLTDGALYYTQSQVSRGWMDNTRITVTYLHHTFRRPINKGEDL